MTVKVEPAGAATGPATSPAPDCPPVEEPDVVPVAGAEAPPVTVIVNWSAGATRPAMLVSAVRLPSVDTEGTVSAPAADEASDENPGVAPIAPLTLEDRVGTVMKAIESAVAAAAIVRTPWVRFFM